MRHIYKDFPLIATNPEMFAGQPVFLHTRISVEQILVQLSNGESVDQILADYPRLSNNHISQALGFSARLTRFDTSTDLAYA